MIRIHAFAAALAAVLMTSTAFASEADQGDFFAKFEGRIGVDETVTASIDPDEAKPEAADKKDAAVPTRTKSPALTAVERSSGRKMKALPGVKKVEGASTAKEAKKGAAASGDRKYARIVSRYASTYGIPASLAHAVISIESNYRETARGRAGEIGLMQIKPATARMMGYSGSTKGLFDPETNIRYGIKYLAKAKSLSDGSTCGTILKYNAGHGAKRMNPVSAAYCAKVKRILGS